MKKNLECFGILAITQLFLDLFWTKSIPKYSARLALQSDVLSNSLTPFLIFCLGEYAHKLGASFFKMATFCWHLIYRVL